MLPSDRYLASLLGLTDEQYLYFKAEVERRAKSSRSLLLSLAWIRLRKA